MKKEKKIKKKKAKQNGIIPKWWLDAKDRLWGSLRIAEKSKLWRTKNQEACAPPSVPRQPRAGEDGILGTGHPPACP